DFAFYPPSLSTRRVRGRVNQTPASSKNATNDSNVGYTHPQTPSAREGAFNPSSKSSLRVSNASVAIYNSSKIDCHDSTLCANSRNDGNPYWAKYFTNSRNDESKINPQ
ncbi:hypothetical protein, partial [Helicobacter sp. T3_23-1059]